jgi:hypothetical protein
MDRARCSGSSLGDRPGANIVAAAEHQASGAIWCADRDLEQQLRAERKPTASNAPRARRASRCRPAA